jgi:hypothetical protein
LSSNAFMRFSISAFKVQDSAACRNTEITKDLSRWSFDGMEMLRSRHILFSLAKAAADLAIRVFTSSNMAL